MSSSYEAIHFRLVTRYGSASTHICTCGNPAQDWAYQHNGKPELYDPLGNVYVEDLACYTPMCRSCHRRLDNQHNPEYLEWLKTEGAALARANLDAEKMKEVGRALGNRTAERWKNDAEYQEKMRSILRENIKVALATPQDPVKVSRDRAAAARKANAIRRTCDECGLTAHPAAVGKHQKGTGHRGHTDN